VPDFLYHPEIFAEAAKPKTAAGDQESQPAAGMCFN
jgi:hypothetical protein